MDLPFTVNSKGHKLYKCTSDGQIIEDLEITDGVLQIHHANVTVRNVRVRTTKGQGSYNIEVRAGAKGVLVELAFRVGVNAALFAQAKSSVSNPQEPKNIKLIGNYLSGGGALTVRHGGTAGGEVSCNVFAPKPPKDPIVAPNMNKAYLAVQCGKTKVSNNIIAGSGDKVDIGTSRVLCY